MGQHGTTNGFHMTTLFERIWRDHAILEQDGRTLLFVDRHYVHEGSHHAFDRLDDSHRRIRHPELTFGTADHYMPSAPARASKITQLMIERLDQHTRQFNVANAGPGNPDRGIVHVTMPERGLSLPGSIIVCGDSHTATHGALGALAFGIGASEVAHVLATQTIWQRYPETMAIGVKGRLAHGVTAKDLILFIIGSLGVRGGVGHAVEYRGEGIEALSMEERMTLCNMTIEFGAKYGLIAPDASTIAWLAGRPMAPRGEAWDQACRYWSEAGKPDDTDYDQVHEFNAADVLPMVSWGTTPQDVVPVTSRVPAGDDGALAYMGLVAGTPIEGIAIDRAFIGSCTNGRYSDLRQAAAILQGQTVKVPLLVTPGSEAVAAQAARDGLKDIFIRAGAEWGQSGCSLCVAMNGDLVAPGERCASSTNRNFRGRQGPGARTHLMSPAMVAAAALTGHITDVRTFLP